jgi:translation initiation factor 1
MARKKERLENDLTGGRLSHNPFAALGGGGAGGDGAPSSGGASGAGASPAPTATPAPARGGKLVVRFEAKGHGGKPVTRVQGLALDDAALEGLARELRRALGAGARVDGADLLVQGRQEERVIAWLADHGHGRAVRGN